MLRHWWWEILSTKSKLASDQLLVILLCTMLADQALDRDPLHLHLLVAKGLKMADAEDAQRLRDQWTPEVLRRYEGTWIAFKRGEVRASSSSLNDLSGRYQNEIASGDGPI